MSTYCFHCMVPKENEGPCPRCGWVNRADPDPHHLPQGSILSGRYLIGRVLGEGGFGITYIGRDLHLNIVVAIKEFFPVGYATRDCGFTSEVTVIGRDNDAFFGGGKEKFIREAQVLARFSGNKNIVDVRNYFEDNNTAYIVMEYINGITLSAAVKNYGRFNVRDLVGRMMPMLGALRLIHQNGLIHRDISPDNIMLLPDGTLKLMDFGAAREVNFADAHSLSVVLKPGYAPLEQYRTRGQQGPWTDIYALCATIYKCITGVTPEASTDRVYGDALKPPSCFCAELPPAYEKVLMKGMAVNQQERFQSIEQLMAAFQWAEQSGEAAVQPWTDTPVPPPSPPLPPSPVSDPGAGKRKRKRIILWSVIGGSATLLLGAGVLAAVILLNLFANSSAVNTETISAGGNHTVALKNDGTAVAIGDNTDGRCNVGKWDDLISVDAGFYYTVGLKSDGTVVAVGENESRILQVGGWMDVEDWTDIVAVSAGDHHTLGLKSDGTVVATGYKESGRCNVGNWTEIAAVCAGATHSVAVKTDGTVVAVGENDYGQCNVGKWTDVVAVSAGNHHTVGLKKDGTVVAVGKDDDGSCDVDSWTDIVAVSAGMNFTVGLKKDGTVVAVGEDDYGKCDVGSWKNVVAIGTGYYHTVALMSDGTAIATGKNTSFQCDVDDWTDIRLPSAAK